MDEDSYQGGKVHNLEGTRRYSLVLQLEKNPYPNILPQRSSVLRCLGYQDDKALYQAIVQKT